MSEVRCYIAGKMRGVKDFNFDAFYAAEVEVHNMFAQCGETIVSPDKPIPTDLVELWGITPGVIGDSGQKCGVTMFNPARRDHETYGPDVNKSETGDLADLPDFDLREALAADLGWIAENATHIYMLDGWENSKGARAEKALAEALGLTVLYQSEPTVTEGDARDWDEFWEDTTGIDQDALPDYETPSLADTLAPYTVTSEVRTVSSTGGEKGMKRAQLGAIDPQSLLRLAEVAGFGARKYARLNYMNGFDWSLAFDAAQRHLLEFWNGTDRDPESGLPHLAHAAWQCLALLTFMERGLGADDRYSSTV